MTVLHVRLLAIGAVCLALALAGCAQTVKVRVDGPHTAAKLGEVALGQVPSEGAPVEVPVGLAAVPYEVRQGEQVATGTIARTEPNPWLLGAGLGAVACCVPSALVLGFCIANPGLLAAPALLAVGIGDLGALTASCVAPSWATLPVLSGCGALGLSPALLGLVADAPPAEVTLPAPTGAAAPGNDGAAAPSAEVAF
ncbi:MAG: hypothetical protein HYS27_16720 [Deltaproteobacteria bacterium]|nr:hypothetical protein [Deltaproteobacteria bacterium]